MTGEAPPARARHVVRRNRRRYGGYIVHVGIACCSSASRRRRRSSTSPTCGCAPGDSARGRRLRGALRRRPAGATARGTVRGRSLRRRLARRRDGGEPPRCDRARLLPDERPDARAGRPLLRRRGDSEIGLNAGLLARLLGRERPTGAFQQGRRASSTARWPTRAPTEALRRGRRSPALLRAAAAGDVPRASSRRSSRGSGSAGSSWSPAA